MIKTIKKQYGLGFRFALDVLLLNWKTLREEF